LSTKQKHQSNEENSEHLPQPGKENWPYLTLTSTKLHTEGASVL